MAWDLRGNAGTDPARDFLGTTNLQPVVIKTNNKEVVRIHADAPDGKVAMVLKTGSGNLGIGTADPFSQLEIAGNAPFITLRDSVGADPVGGHGRCFIQGIHGNMVLKPSSGDAHAVVLRSGGGVGIG